MNTFKLLFSKKARNAYEQELGEATGIFIGDNSKINSQGTFFHLLVKGLVVFLALMGSLESYMSAFGIAYDFNFMAVVCGVIAVVTVVATINTILMVVVYSFIIYYLSVYAVENQGVLISGGLAVINMSYNLISQKYKLPSVDGFDEMIPDRSVTVPALIIGALVVAGLIIALFVCKFSCPAMVVVLTLIPVCAALFFEGVPSEKGIIMVVSSWGLSMMLKFSGKDKTAFRRKIAPAYYKGKIYLWQRGDGLTLIQSAVYIVAIFALWILISQNIMSFKTYDEIVPRSKLKESVDYAVRDTMIIAFSNYKNYSISPTAIGGQLGFYGNSQPDFETDLKVKLLPFTTDRLYFKTYTGSDYGYKKNQWYNVDSSRVYNDPEVVSSIGKAVKNSGTEAEIEINNVGIAGSPAFMPYYTILDENTYFEYVADDIINSSLPLGENQKMTFYPLTEPVEGAENKDYREYVYNTYLSVPEELKPKIKSLCSGQGIKRNDENLEEKINNYFQNNFEYDMQSGRLPWQTDFVEYFLFETKAGVCAHFATAATLMYRSLGIPARYAEGYCADYVQFIQGKAVDEENPQEWLKGTRPLSNKVMEAELSDYNAHAWVEIYKDGVGWVVTDPTPYADPELLKKEKINASTLEELLTYFNEIRYLDGAKNIGNKISEGFFKFLRFLAIILMAVFTYKLALKGLIFNTAYAIRSRSSSKKLARYYFNCIKAIGEYGELIKSEDFYREVGFVLNNLGMESGEAYIRLTEKSIYSEKGIDQEELKQLKLYHKAAVHTLLKALKPFKRLRVILKYIFTKR